MRESSKGEKKHLPADTYEEWLKFQAVKPAGTKHATKVTKDLYETWMAKRTEKRVHADHKVKR